MDAKLKRRLFLLDDLIDLALRTRCCFAMCNGPEAPIRDMQTCVRCACIHRALQMGLVKKVKERYIRETKHGTAFVDKGVLEQYSVVDGQRI